MLNSLKSKSGIKRTSHPKTRSRKKRRVTIQVDDKQYDSAVEADESDSSENQEIDWKRLEEELEHNAAKANLTATNVKSILHHILSDKRLLEYATSAADANNQTIDEFNETKLTRSRAKLLGKKPLQIDDKPKFIDAEFSENSGSDTDYEPGIEDEETSQDEELSTYSDAYSDMHSPFVKTNSSSPINTEIVSESEVSGPMKEKNPSLAESFKLPTGSSNSKEDQNIDLISAHTRSRFPMPHIHVEELEAMFQPPDVDDSDYEYRFQAMNNDPEKQLWLNWLMDFKKPLTALNDTAEEEANDEDFNYMEAAADNTEPELEEFRDDKATRITQKELHDLFNELLLGHHQSAYETQDNDMYYQYCDTMESDACQKGTNEIRSEVMLDASKDLILTSEQRQQISAQMQQHLQMLTQIYLLSCTSPALKMECNQSQQYVEELARFHDRTLEKGLFTNMNVDYTIFCTPGIVDACRIIGSLQGTKLVTKKSSACKNPLNDTIANLIATEPYFATYIELLPEQGMITNLSTTKKGPSMNRIKFLKAEDNLLALGLSQWKGKKDRFELIAQHLLPTKTAKQLQVRVKNLCATRHEANPVAVVQKQSYLPELDVTFKVVVPREISSIALWKLPRGIMKRRKTLPPWFYRIYKKLQLNEGIKNQEKLAKNHTEKNNLFPLAAKLNAGSQLVQNPKVTPPILVPKKLSLCGQSASVSTLSLSQYSNLLASTPVSLGVSPSNQVKQSRLCFSQPISKQSQHHYISSATSKSKVNRSLSFHSQSFINKEPIGVNISPINNSLVNDSMFNKSGCCQNRDDNVSDGTLTPSRSVLGNSTESITSILSQTSLSTVYDMELNGVKPLVDLDTTRVPNHISHTNLESITDAGDLDTHSSKLQKEIEKDSKQTTMKLKGVENTPTKANSKDNFNVPMTQLLNNIPMPYICPQSLIFSPSKPPPDISLIEVKQLLKTPQKEMINEKTRSELLLTPNTTLFKDNAVQEAISGGDDSLENSHNHVLALLQPLVQENVVKNIHVEHTDELNPDPIESSVIQLQCTENSKECVSDDTSNEKIDEVPPKNKGNGEVEMKTELISQSSFGKLNDVSQISNYACPHELAIKFKEETVGHSCSEISVTVQETAIDSCSEITIPDSNESNPGMFSPDGISSSLSCCSGPVNSDSEVEMNHVNPMPVISVEKENSTVCTKTNTCNNNESVCKPKEFTSVKRQKKRKVPAKKRVFNYDEKLKKKAKSFAKIYYNRVKDTLADKPEICSQFFEILESVNGKQLTKLETYYKISELLVDYPELVDNFVGFLEQHESRHVGKFMQWLIYDQVIQFHLVCEEHFYNVPGWYGKINQKVVEVMESEKDQQKIVDAIIPMFRGNQNLTNLFIRIFPDLPPPMCDDDDFEVIDYQAYVSGTNEIDDFEEIAYQPPDNEVLSFHDDGRCRRGGAISRNNSDVLKYPKRKSNTNITASKLRQLATKRKKSKSAFSKGLQSSSTCTTCNENSAMDVHDDLTTDEQSLEADKMKLESKVNDKTNLKISLSGNLNNKDKEQAEHSNYVPEKIVDMTEPRISFTNNPDVSSENSLNFSSNSASGQNLSNHQASIMCENLTFNQGSTDANAKQTIPSTPNLDPTNDNSLTFSNNSLSDGKLVLDKSKSLTNDVPVQATPVNLILSIPDSGGPSIDLESKIDDTSSIDKSDILTSSFPTNTPLLLENQLKVSKLDELCTKPVVKEDVVSDTDSNTTADEYANKKSIYSGTLHTSLDSIFNSVELKLQLTDSKVTVEPPKTDIEVEKEEKSLDVDFAVVSSKTKISSPTIIEISDNTTNSSSKTTVESSDDTSNSSSKTTVESSDDTTNSLSKTTVEISDDTTNSLSKTNAFKNEESKKTTFVTVVCSDGDSEVENINQKRLPFNNISTPKIKCATPLDDAGLLHNENARICAISVTDLTLKYVSDDKSLHEQSGQDLTFGNFSNITSLNSASNQTKQRIDCAATMTSASNCELTFPQNSIATSTSQNEPALPKQLSFQGKISPMKRRIARSDIITLETKDGLTAEEFQASPDDFSSRSSMISNCETTNDLAEVTQKLCVASGEQCEKVLSWTRDEDFIILASMKNHGGDTNNAVMNVFKQLHLKYSIDQIKNRLEFLLEGFEDDTTEDSDDSTSEEEENDTENEKVVDDK